MRSIPLSTNSQGSNGRLGAGQYDLMAALNGDTNELHDMNEDSALNRILNRDVAEPIFPASLGGSGVANRIVREMREERIRQVNPAKHSSLSRGLYPRRTRELIGGVDEQSLQEIEQMLQPES